MERQRDRQVNTTKFAKISAIKNNGEIEKNEQV
jgi:hypothetical protein